MARLFHGASRFLSRRWWWVKFMVLMLPRQTGVLIARNRDSLGRPVR